MATGNFGLMTLVLALSATAGAQTSSDQPIARVEVNDLRVVSVASDRIQFAGRVMLRANDRVEVHRVAFNGVTLAGTPVFLAPIDTRFEIQAGALSVLPGELQITTYFRDLDAAAFERALSSPAIKVEGEAAVDAELNFFQSVALLRRTVTAHVQVSGELPVTFPGGPLTRDAVLLALRTFKPVLGAGGAAVNGATSSLGLSWNQEMLQRYGDSLVYVVSTYNMRDKRGSVTPFSWTGVGFRISPSDVVVPKEAVRPWEFDTRAILLAQTAKAKVVAEGTDLLLFTQGMRVEGSPQSPTNGLSLARREVTLVREGDSDAEVSVVADGKDRRRASVQKRVSLKNVAMLRISDAGAAAPSALANDIERGKPFWDKVAIFRGSVREDGVVRFDAVAARVRRNGAALVIEDAVDRAAVGSPVASDAGIIAFVQDERGGSMLAEALTANNLRASASGISGNPAANAAF